MLVILIVMNSFCGVTFYLCQTGSTGSLEPVRYSGEGAEECHHTTDQCG